MATSFCIAMAFGVGLGCTEPAHDRPTADTYCKISETIYASRKDTPETLRQIRRENAKRRKCPKVSVDDRKGATPTVVLQVGKDA